MTIEAAMAELKCSPAFFDHIAQLRQAAEDEQQRREQFIEDLDEDTKAEFINGQVVMHSPVRLEHLDVSFFATNLLGNFVLQRGLGRVFTEKCLVRCQRNDYEPDLCFFAAAKVAEFTPAQMIFPPPDLIVEILSPSTEKNDRTIKLQDYARHGVGEYWIIDADARTVEQHLLPPGAESYPPTPRLTGGGRLVSAVLTGFSISVPALFDTHENQRALQALLGA